MSGKSSSGGVKIKQVASYGINMFFKYVNNIKEGRKIIKSWICLISILVGGIFFSILPFAIPYISKSVAYLLQYDRTNWLSNTLTFFFFFIMGTSVGGFIGNLGCKMYYYFKYKNSNIHYVSLNLLPNYEIDVVKFQFKLRNIQVKLNKDQILNIDNNIINIIKNKKMATDKKLMKTAHERFRDGLLIQAMLTHPIVIYLIEQEINDEKISNEISKYYMPITFTSSNHPSPKEGSLSERIKYIKELMDKINNEIKDLEFNVDRGCDIPIEMRKNTSCPNFQNSKNNYNINSNNNNNINNNNNNNNNFYNHKKIISISNIENPDSLV
jgi:hypothetical protein